MTIPRVRYIHPSAVLRIDMITLTAVPGGRVRWDEIHLEAGMWTMPASRMKSGCGFSVPLDAVALGILDGARAQFLDSSLVFPT